MGKELKSDWYDEVFAKSAKYHGHYNDCGNWTKIWKASMPLLQLCNALTILDIGSGMGQFGQLCYEHGYNYKGLDFSSYAIHHSAHNSIGNEIYQLTDINTYDFKDDVDVYTSHEFLEHIEDDLGILKRLESGKPIIFSVPNSDGIQHTRFFLTEEAVEQRYSTVIDNLEVTKITDQHFIGHGILK